MCQPILLLPASARVLQSSNGRRLDMAPHVARSVKSDNAYATCPGPLMVESWHRYDRRNPKRSRAEAYCQLSAEYDRALGEVPNFAHVLNLMLKKEERRYSAIFSLAQSPTPSKHNSRKTYDEALQSTFKQFIRNSHATGVLNRRYGTLDHVFNVEVCPYLIEYCTHTGYTCVCEHYEF